MPSPLLTSAIAPDRPCLSKSKFLAGSQCQKLLWNDCHAQDQISEPGVAEEAIFAQGHQVGILARSQTTKTTCTCYSFNGKSNIMPIKRKRNLPWNWDELILALELYFDNPKSRTSTAIINKSNLPKELRILRETFYGDSSNTYRNANGIYQKMQNFVSLDPDCKARGQHGRPNGGRFDKVIWDEYHDDLPGLKRAAHVTRESMMKPDWKFLDESKYDIEDHDDGKQNMQAIRLPTGAHLLKLFKMRQDTSIKSMIRAHRI
jgi:hypothetical protein